MPAIAERSDSWTPELLDALTATARREGFTGREVVFRSLGGNVFEIAPLFPLGFGPRAVKIELPHEEGQSLADAEAQRRAIQFLEPHSAAWCAAIETFCARPKLLPDGTLGYCGRFPRTDDCFAAAIATTLQVPIEQIPDPRIDERLDAGDAPEAINRSLWNELGRWLGDRGLRVTWHRTVPVGRRRWIGVVPMPGDFNDHCLVMNRDEVLFDPVGLVGQDGTSLETGRSTARVRVFRPEEIAYGLSFQSTPRPKTRRN